MLAGVGLVNSTCRDLVIDVHMLMSLSWSRSRSYCSVAKVKSPTLASEPGAFQELMQKLYEALKLTCHEDCVKEVLIFAMDETWTRELCSYFISRGKNKVDAEPRLLRRRENKLTKWKVKFECKVFPGSFYNFCKRFTCFFESHTNDLMDEDSFSSFIPHEIT